MIRDAVVLAIAAGTAGVPRFEHRAHCAVQLLEDVSGQREPRRGGDRLTPTGKIVGTAEDAGINLEHDRRIQFDEAAVRVASEPLLITVRREEPLRRVVDTEVQDCVHHPRHRDRSAGSH